MLQPRGRQMIRRKKDRGGGLPAYGRPALPIKRCSWASSSEVCPLSDFKFFNDFFKIAKWGTD